jgi:hypothetical protein
MTSRLVDNSLTHVSYHSHALCYVLQHILSVWVVGAHTLTRDTTSGPPNDALS